MCWFHFNPFQLRGPECPSFCYEYLALPFISSVPLLSSTPENSGMRLQATLPSATSKDLKFS